jgi:hypothetical protein
MLACTTDTLVPDSMLLPVMKSRSPECYPFTQTMYVVAPVTYNTTLRGPPSCVSGHLTVDYGVFLFNQSSNDNALHIGGIARVTENAEIAEYISDVLTSSNSFTCDGLNMMDSDRL